MSKIIGNTTTTPVPRSDWSQTDKTKADFIRHKPELGAISEKDEINKSDLTADVQLSLEQIDTKANVETVSSEEYKAIEESGTANANTLYIITDAKDENVFVFTHSDSASVDNANIDEYNRFVEYYDACGLDGLNARIIADDIGTLPAAIFYSPTTGEMNVQGEYGGVRYVVRFNKESDVVNSSCMSSNTYNSGTFNETGAFPASQKSTAEWVKKYVIENADGNINIDALGALATKDIVNKSDLASDIQTSLNKADSALQSIPSEYVTETELNAKGYLTQHQDLSSYAKKTELSSHNTDASAHADIREELNQLSSEIANNNGGAFNIADAMCPPNQLAADGSTFGDYNEETEELYTGEGCHPGSDFNYNTVVYKDITDYIDKVIARHPQYVWKEAMGLDASGLYTVNRYILSQCYYRAWQRENYPKMFAWINGSTKIYSVSVSPRIGDTMYSTTYIGTSYGTVSANDSANQTRTVGGKVFTRSKADDVEPTILYTIPSCLAKVNGTNGMYDSSKKTITTLKNQIAAINSEATAAGVSYNHRMNEILFEVGSLVADNGYKYIRNPIYDRNEDMSVPIKVVIGCNEHGNPGDPPAPAICCARLIKDLADGVDNRMMNYLRKNTIVLAMPVINPWGFSVHDSRDGYRNYNGININRNYDTPGWNANADTGPSGEYAGSENETQYFMNTVCLGNVAVSYHGLGTTEQQCAYQFNGYLNQNPNSQTTIYDVSVKNSQIGAVMLQHYNWSFVYYNEASPATMAKSPSYITHAGCTGGLIEMCASQGAKGEPNYGLFTSLAMEGDYSLMLMTLYSFIHDYDKSVRI